MAAAAAITLFLSCATTGGPGQVAGSSTESRDPSRDMFLAETFLDIPRSGSGVSAGIDAAVCGDGSSSSREAFFRFDGGRVSAAARFRKREGDHTSAFHAAVSPCRYGRIDIGDIVPDVGIGLLSSTRRFDYPFSSGHPLYGPKGVRRWTGFYGPFIRGLSLSAGNGHLGLVAIGGIKSVHTGKGVESRDPGYVSGIRASFRSGALCAGMTTLSGCSSGGGRISGLDLRISSGGRTVMVETSLAENASPAAVWGISTGSTRLRFGLIGWTVPRLSEGFLASFPGLSAASSEHRSGMSMVMRVKAARRLYFSSWIEARRNGDGRRETVRISSRFEMRVSRNRFKLRAAARIRSKGARRCVPYPPGEPQYFNRSSDTVVSVYWRGRGRGPSSVGLEIRRPGGDGGRGIIVSARGRLRLPWYGIRLYASSAVYRASRGNPRFSLYEPSPAGRYPWKALFGSGKRLKTGIDLEVGTLSVSIWFLWAVSSPAEAGLRLTADI